MATSIIALPHYAEMPLTEDALSRYKLAAATICVGILGAIFTFVLVLHASLRQMEQEFVTQARLHTTLLEDWLSLHLQELQMLSHVIAGRHMSETEFLTLTRSMIGINAFTSLYWLAQEDKEESLITRHAAQIERASGDLQALLMNPDTAAALKEALSTQLPTATSLFTLPGESTNKSLIAFIFPIPSPGNASAAIVAILPLATITAKAFDWKDRSEDVEGYLFEQAQNGDEMMRYGATPALLERIAILWQDLSPELIGNSAAFHYSAVLRLPSRQWTAVFTPTSEYMSRAAGITPWVTITICLMLTATVGALLFQLIGQNVRVEALVRRRTAELTQAGRELAKAKEAAERANAAKSDFLANMSHELRTPMHAVLSFARLGSRKIDRLPKAKLLYYLQTIESSGTRLLTLLDALLDLSKLEAGKMQYIFTKADLQDVVNTSLTELRPLITERNIIIRVQEPEINTETACDFFRLVQVVHNLLSNALKFTPAGKHIILSYAPVFLANAEPGIALSVSDQGVGLPEDETERVFDKFFQSSRTRTGAGGTGLGLSICKEIITAHRGRIHAANNADGGAIFTIELPIQQPYPTMTAEICA